MAQKHLLVINKMFKINGQFNGFGFVIGGCTGKKNKNQFLKNGFDC